jgi:lipoprotein signal peptidase
MGFTTLERWCIAAIWAGGLGNMIDRIRLGYVVDMICTDFIRFPVFNVADIFITCGCILLLVHLVFFNKAFWKDEKK